MQKNQKKVEMMLSYNFQDTGEQFTLEIRKGVVQLHEGVLADADVKIDTSRDVLNQMLIAGPNAQQVIGKNIQEGKFTFASGKLESFGLFMSYFDAPLPVSEIMMSVR